VTATKTLKPRRLGKPSISKTSPASPETKNTETAAPAKKRAPARKANPAAPKKTVEYDAYGFTTDSDMSLVLGEMIKGGRDKHEVSVRIGKLLADRSTRTGKPKPVSTIMNQVERQMLARGFEIDGRWKFVPPPADKLAPKTSVRRGRPAAQKPADAQKSDGADKTQPQAATVADGGSGPAKRRPRPRAIGKKN
jgi:hypothetical protein